METLALPRDTMTTHHRSDNTALPAALWLWSFALGLVIWCASALRHRLLQSNAYDLGLFDQWAWLIGSGQPPISSMEGVHLMADHGAWLFYLAGAAYALLPSVQWLLASQALALSFTAVPIWMLARQAGLSGRQCWLACALWWLQPVVFNASLFDVHPETWVMPALALALWAERAQRPRLWLILLLLLLGARDGLVLITAGMAIELAWKRRWRWSATAAVVSLSWLILLSRWLYPWLRGGAGPKAAGRMFGHLSGEPLSVLQSLDWEGGLLYLLLLSLPCLWLWRRRSLPTLLIAAPLLLTNLLSASPSYRTLIHHYSLPLGVVAVLAAIDGLSGQPRSKRAFPWTLSWALACWLALAKPWFFTGPYLERIAMVGDTQAAIALVQANDRVLTTSYLVPHLSHRRQIAFAKKKANGSLDTQAWDLVLLQPRDPGWGSAATSQKRLLNDAKQLGWDCRQWPSGLSLCRNPKTPSPKGT